MKRKDSRSVMRSVMSAPQHIPDEPLQEDYAATTVGGQGDAGIMGMQSWPGSKQFDMGEDSGCPFEKTVRMLNEYQAGDLTDEDVIGMFTRLVETGLIEYMNEDVRNTAAALVQAGYINTVTEAKEFTRDVEGQPSQQGYPDFDAKRDGPPSQAGYPEFGVKKGSQYKTNSTAPISTIGNTGNQQAQMAPAQIPSPSGKQVTSKGHDKFPDSGGKKENPPKVPNPVGKQKAGPNHGDDMAGGGKGVTVGQSLQQGTDTEQGEYTGSQVGRIKEQMACPLPDKKSDDKDKGKGKKLRRVKRRQPE